MADPNEPTGMNDPYDLSRFVEAQEGDYEKAIAEIRSGRKHSHLMWYVFPQFEGRVQFHLPAIRDQEPRGGQGVGGRAGSGRVTCMALVLFNRNDRCR
jgi:hypothetical protein